MKLLVIGGAGYIGSHFIRQATRLGHECAVYDNLSTGHRQSVPADMRFFHEDLLDPEAVAGALRSYQPDAVLHFAALALVGESVSHPSQYYLNNVEGVRLLLESLREWNPQCPLIFSSTCAVFGVPESLPIAEDDPKKPISPYGRSKLMAEYLLEDYAKAYGMKTIALRYFNACGADESGEIGEDHQPETHLIPNIIRSVLKKQALTIFGGDFPTKDGTCVRDYIHVADLADAHLRAINFLNDQAAGTFEAIHLGKGAGFSNLEIVKAAEQALDQSIDYSIGMARAGDPPSLYSAVDKAKRLLGFEATRSDLSQILNSAIAWHTKHPEGFRSEDS